MPAAFGGLIVECGGEGGEESLRCLCPGEGGAGAQPRERGSGEGCFRLIDLAGRPGADGNEEVRFGGEDRGRGGRWRRRSRRLEGVL